MEVQSYSGDKDFFWWGEGGSEELFLVVSKHIIGEQEITWEKPSAYQYSPLVERGGEKVPLYAAW